MAGAPPNRIGELRAQRRISQQDLAEQIGTSNQQISRLETGKGNLTQEWMRKIADALGVSPADLLPEEERASSKPPPPANDEVRFAGTYMPSQDSIPVYASAEAGLGEMSIGEQIGTIPRPPPLEGVTGGYAVHIVGDSMEPVLEQGTLVWVSPTPPRSGQLCIIQLKDHGDGEHRAMVKRYRRSRADFYVVLQYNPESEIDLEKRRVDKLHKIVGATFE